VKDLERINGGPLKGRVRDAAAFLNEQRVIKDFMEVERLQKACNITAQALVDAMRECEPGQYEFETESVIEGTFLRYGSTMPGFPSILGSGPNSTILHYEQNTRKTEDGDLLLMDVGAEYGMYSADITRTIPVSGKFTRDQLMVYQLVLDAQKAAIEKMKPGNYFTDGQIAARKVLVRGLADLGLITDTTSPWQIRFYILHGFSHYLGMDVHDVGDMGGTFESFMQKIDQDIIESRILEPGMVLTIEPGLYFRPDGLKNAYKQLGSEADSAEIAAFTGEIAPVYERFINMGVRIEDDILVTPAGNICLSRYAPKEPGDIEQIMR
jgi:Xaa-Pro aminopeptidase